MTVQEFEAWIKHTDRSRNQWQVDPIRLHNRGEYLMYRGGEAGTYVWIVGAEVSVGSYEGAFPHIGEAIFKRNATKVFLNQNDAMCAVASSTGIQGLLALLGAW